MSSHPTLPAAFEAHHALLWDTMLQGVVFQDAQGTILSMNPAASRILGKSPEEVLAQTSVSLERDTLREHGTPFPGVEHPAMVALRTGQEQRDVVMGVFNPRERRYRWISISAVPLFRPGGSAPSQVYTLFDDITDRKEAEAQLEETRSYLQGVLDVAAESIWLFSAEGVALAGNRTALARWGQPPESILGKRVEQVLPEPLATSRLARLKEAVATGRPVRFEDTRAGILFEHTFYPVAGPHGIDRVAIFSRDITERRRAEEASRRAEAEKAAREAQAESAAELQEAQRIAHLGSWTLDLASGAFQASVELCHLLGRDPSRPPASLAEAAEGAEPGLKVAALDALARVKAGEGPVSWEGQLVRPDGSKRWLVLRLEAVRDAEGVVTRVRGTAQDVTEHRVLEQELSRSRRQDAIGSLAGGVAHDFNNLLGVILGYTESALEGLPEATPEAEDLREVVAAARRGAALTRQLLAFARRQVVRPELLDPNQVVEELAKLLRRVIGENIDLRLQLSGQAGLVLADPAQLEQVVMNLALNARDAIDGPGVLTVATEAVEVGPPQAPAGVRPGRYLQLTVADTGAGMDAATLARIYEPFFTTKGPGKGTGLGLPTVQGIVHQAGGFLEVESQPGRGTTFRVLLPSAPGQLAGSGTPAPRLVASAGEGVLLLVEDDAALRSLVARTLARAGYQVLVASDGEEAARVAREAPHLDLLVSDVVLPKLGGPEVARTARAAHPGLEVLFVSGHVEEAAVRLQVLGQGQPFLAKPFSVTDLLSEVGRLRRRQRSS